ncbi:hypothetical protein HS7_18200 [Sulfolobales archaeon HS-7]|nr:hypothetical protein HS7_18200 [Sulfolobales archaeon HS-7]
MVNPSDHLANKRTFLAWIRTGIALMGFGFVIAKFQLFLRLILKEAVGKGYTGSLLIIAGVAIIAYALYEYLETEKELKNERFQARTVSAVILAIALIAISIFLVFSIGIGF